MMLIILIIYSGQYYVTINYRHGTEVTPWKLADCDYKCPLDEFVLKTKNRVPTDRQAECHATKHQQDHQTPVFLSYKGKCFILKFQLKPNKKNNDLDYQSYKLSFEGQVFYQF